MKLAQIVEAYLIASADPLSSEQLVTLVKNRVAEAKASLEKAAADSGEKTTPSLPDALKAFNKITVEDIEKAVAELNANYEKHERSFAILERAKGWKCYTRALYAPFIRQLFPDQKPKRLSAPATETLSIIAYRQPVTKAAIEAVRGVSSDGMLHKLLDLEFIHVSGRSDLPGRPLLYSTTDTFFEHFGISSIDDLPNSAELRRVSLPEPEPEVEEPQAEQLSLTAVVSPEDSDEQPSSQD